MALRALTPPACMPLWDCHHRPRTPEVRICIRIQDAVAPDELHALDMRGRFITLLYVS